MTVVNDLGGNSEPLKLLGSLRSLISLVWLQETLPLPLKSAKFTLPTNKSQCFVHRQQSCTLTFDLIEVAKNLQDATKDEDDN